MVFNNGDCSKNISNSIMKQNQIKMTNLTQDYVEFVEKGESLGCLAQEVIDKLQYSEGFFAALQQLLDKHESPFEVVTTENGTVRRLKAQFYNKKDDNNVS
jgi:hypothetical protein